MAASSSSSSQDASQLKSGLRKRRLHVVVACNECRRRKVKCDGNRPRCWFCSTRDLPCQYTADPDAPPITALKRKYEMLERDYSARGELIAALLAAPAGESQRILAAIRSGSDFASAVQATRNISSPSPDVDGDIGGTSLRRRLPRHCGSPCKCVVSKRRLSLDRSSKSASRLRKIKTVASLHTAASPHDSRLSVQDERLLHANPNDWGLSYLDQQCFQDILASYLAWDHPSYRFFDETAFMEGIRTGPSEFCSSLLVHSVIFVGCKSYAFVNPERAAIVEHFALVEAKKLWVIETTHDSCANVAAGLMIHFGLGCAGLDREGYPFLAQALHMSENLGLYSPTQAANVYDPTVASRTRGRLILAWGCFVYRCLFSLIMHDMSLSGTMTAPPLQLPRDAPHDDCYPWRPWPQPEPRLPCHKNELHRSRSAFFSIVAEIQPLHFRFASDDPSPTYLRSALEIYDKLRQWYSELHPALLENGSGPPQLLSLHNDYHFAIVELFRPLVSSRENASPTPAVLQRAYLPAEVPLTATLTASRMLRRLVERHDRLYCDMPTSASFFTPRLVVLFESMPKADVRHGDSESRLVFVFCLLLFRRMTKYFAYHRYTLVAIQQAARRMDIHLPPAALRILAVNEAERQLLQDGSRIHSAWVADLSLKSSDPDAARLSNVIQQMQATRIFSEQRLKMPLRGHQTLPEGGDSGTHKTP